jgi:hypothetical protein
MNDAKKTRILQYINFDYKLDTNVGAPQQKDYASYSPDQKKLLLKFESFDNAFNHNRFIQEESIPKLLAGTKKDLSSIDFYITGNNGHIKRANELRAEIKKNRVRLPDNINIDRYFDDVINYFTQNNNKLEPKKAELASQAQLPPSQLEVDVQNFSDQARELADKAKKASTLAISDIEQLIQEGENQVKKGIELFRKTRDSAKAELKNTVMTASGSLSNSVNSLKTSLKIAQLPKFD